jgi:electron transfer flavoprotein alpha subunit
MFLNRRILSAHAFVLADHAGDKLSKSTLQVLQAARRLNGKVTLGVFGASAQVVKEASSLEGVSSVVSVSGLSSHVTADAMATGVSSIAKKIQASHIVASTSSSMKDSLPRVGALMDLQPIADVIDILSESTFKRPMYAGNVIATVESQDKVKILTVRPTAFSADIAKASSPCPVTSETLGESQIKFESEESKKSDKVDLATAQVVVSGGRGLKSKENFDALLNPLAEKLKGAVGASRAAVDAGFAANDMQIGQTGKVVAPDLYIAVGISGAIQHLAGMKDSRTIVAINKDKDCPMMQIADYGLVGDLFEIVPELTKKL